MHKFKKGDKVKLKRDAPYEGAWLLKYFSYDDEYVVHDYNDEYIYFLENGVTSPGWYAYRFELVSDAFNNARKLLEEAGYTVTDPKPKKSGKVYVWYNGHSETLNYDKLPPLGFANPNSKLLAALDWTEGDGLPKDNT